MTLLIRFHFSKQATKSGYFIYLLILADIPSFCCCFFVFFSHKQNICLAKSWSIAKFSWHQSFYLKMKDTHDRHKFLKGNTCRIAFYKHKYSPIKYEDPEVLLGRNFL